MTDLCPLCGQRASWKFCLHPWHDFWVDPIVKALKEVLAKISFPPFGR